jgi:hypothetical protein
MLQLHKAAVASHQRINQLLYAIDVLHVGGGLLPPLLFGRDNCMGPGVPESAAAAMDMSMSGHC